MKIGEGQEKEPIIYEDLEILDMIETDQEHPDLLSNRGTFIVKLITIQDEWRKKKAKQYALNAAREDEQLGGPPVDEAAAKKNKLKKQHL